MPKRKVHFATEAKDDVLEIVLQEKKSRKANDGEVDSDDDDEVEDTDVLHDDDIEGQEDASAIDIEEGIRFTPFNMNDEQEEGHFDSEGMFIYDRNKDQIKDSWIEDVDWVKVKETEEAYARKKKREHQDGDVSILTDYVVFDEKQVYRDMVAVMQPQETVMRTIKRLGGGAAAKKQGAAKAAVVNRREQQLNAKRKRLEAMKLEEEATNSDLDNGKSGSDGKTVEGENGDENRREEGMSVDEQSPTVFGTKKLESVSQKGASSQNQELLAFIGLADRVLASGMMEIYEYTYEKLNYELTKADRHAAEEVASAVDAGMDMFADEAPVQRGPVSGKISDVKSSGDSVSRNAGTEPVTASSSSTTSLSVMWEYKWEDTEGAEVHGPFTSTEMLAWTNDGYFPEGVFVRKMRSGDTSASTKFDSSRRIDFDLYV